jgi:hypothetical protein
MINEPVITVSPLTSKVAFGVAAAPIVTLLPVPHKITLPEA